MDQRYFTPVLVIGIVKQTAEGSWLQQSCGDSLKSGDFVWPNAISLKEWGPQEKYWSINNSKWENDFAKQLARLSNEKLDPRDRNGRWVAVYGVLDSRDQLVATPCGKGEICGCGYGPLSAPVQLTFQHIYIFDK